MASRSSIGARSSTSGSTLTKRVSGACRPTSYAPVSAAVGEELVGTLEGALRSAGQCLVGDDLPGVELDDRLEDAAHRTVAQDVVDRRRGSG
jgi:hypothetical protein